MQDVQEDVPCGWSRQERYITPPHPQTQNINTGIAFYWLWHHKHRYMGHMLWECNSTNLVWACRSRNHMNANINANNMWIDQISISWLILACFAGDTHSQILSVECPYLSSIMRWRRCCITCWMMTHEVSADTGLYDSGMLGNNRGMSKCSHRVATPVLRLKMTLNQLHQFQDR